MDKKSLLVIALSARAYAVAAKKAGYDVTVIDVFADQETVSAASAVFTVSANNTGFDKDALLKALKKIDCQTFLGCIYGSGFEAQPALLEEISTYVPLIGNTPQTVEKVKNPQHFFLTLKMLGILYPPVFLTFPPPNNSNQYLIKKIGASGGGHIQFSSQHNFLPHTNTALTDVYYQQVIEGRSLSVLFLAFKQQAAVQHAAKIIGVNEQWVDATHKAPFRFGGAASGVVLNAQLNATLGVMVEKISQTFGLVGLNSLDFILKEGLIYVLEVNPRLSATVDLYRKNTPQNLIKLHMQACLNKPLAFAAQADESTQKQRLVSANKSTAFAVFYAEEDVVLNAEMQWPTWVQDKPDMTTSGLAILKGMPICTAFAQASSAEAAKLLAQTRLITLKKKLFNCNAAI